MVDHLIKITVGTAAVIAIGTSIWMIAALLEWPAIKRTAPVLFLIIAFLIIAYILGDNAISIWKRR